MERFGEYTASYDVRPVLTSVVREPASTIAASFAMPIEPETRKSLHEQVEAMLNQPEPVSADIAIIGGGPGGYVAAIRAAQLGAKVVLIEKDELGGVCLNRGCIPTKVMLSSADAYDMAVRRGPEFGFVADNVLLDYAKVLERRDNVVKQLVSGLCFLMSRHNVQVVKGKARLTSRTNIEVRLGDGTKTTLPAQNIIIATGSQPVTLTVPGLEGPNVWDSDGALSAPEVPKSLLVIGGGAIGLEWGYMFARFGAEVTIVEVMSNILPAADSEVAQELRKILMRSGIRILTNARVVGVEHDDGKETATIMAEDSQLQVTTEKILVAVGRRPMTDGIGLEEAGVIFDQTGIKVDEHMRTNVPNIYAIGDVVGGMLLAHKASEEGVIAAENIMGRSARMKYTTIPSAVYTTPEVAWVGMTEDQAIREEREYRVGKFFFRANGKALGLGETHGFVKFIVEPRYGEVLGCHMIGPHVTDLIQEVVVGMEAEATVDMIGRTVHGHPTLSEVVKEAALDADGESLHKG